MKFTPRRAIYCCVCLMALLVFYSTHKEDLQVTKTDHVDAPSSIQNHSKVSRAKSKEEENDKAAFPVDGTYSNIDNLKGNFMSLSRLSSAKSYMLQPDLNRERILAMSYETVLRKDKAWNGLGISKGINLIPGEGKLKFPGYLIPERGFIKLTKPSPGIGNKDHVDTVEGQRQQLRKFNENIHKEFKEIVRNADAVNIPSIHQNVLLNNARQNEFNPKINKTNEPTYNAKVKPDIHKIQNLPKDLVFQSKYAQVKVHNAQAWKASNGRVFNQSPGPKRYNAGKPRIEPVRYNAGKPRIEPVRNMQLIGQGQTKQERNEPVIQQQGNVAMVGNVQAHNYGLLQRDQIKFPAQPHGNMIIPKDNQLQKPAPLNPKKTVIEIYPRKNEPIRIHMYMQHKGNFSYHHVNLLWEDGQRHPVSPLILQRKQKGVAETRYENHDDVKNTLIMTYMRSGSTITSELLKTDDTFFFFEPFQGLYRDHRTNQHVCYPHGYCRKPDGFWESLEGSVLILKNLFSCKFMEVPVGALEPLRAFAPSSYQKEFKSCFPVKIIDWNNRHFTLNEYPEDYNETCIQTIQNKCLGAKHRLVKTIRMPATFAESFLANIPHLKIVHLVRDPRGVLNSRVQIHLVKYEEKELGIVSHHLCNRIWLDIQTFKRLQRIYPTQVIPLTYECLALYPEDVARTLYKMLELDYTPERNYWLNMAFRNNIEQSFELFKHGQSASLAQKWRTIIPMRSNDKVNKICGKVFEELGLKTFISIVDLRNLKNSVFYDSRRTCLQRK